MAGQNSTTTAARRKSPTPEAADARDGLSVADLARGILSKEFRSRAADVRRLAEAVLAGRAKPKKAKKKNKADSGKKKDKSKNKLAKIPGQSNN